MQNQEKKNKKTKKDRKILKKKPLQKPFICFIAPKPN